MRHDLRHPADPIAGTLAVILAGGSGSRLGALTRHRSKPALPFGGRYCSIDFTLSNCVNSGIERIALLTQYRANSLIEHIHQAWNPRAGTAGGSPMIWPARAAGNSAQYSGTADAVFQNIDRIETLGPEYILVLAADHVYRMDYRDLLDSHIATDAAVTVGCIEVPLPGACGFGVLAVSADGRITRFDEKPDQPVPMPDDPDRALASMGIYIFNRRVLIDALQRDALDARSRHDFGRNILPGLVADDARVFGHAFRNHETGRPAYWRDVGTLESYWRANMELLVDRPDVDLHDRSWPIRGRPANGPPARFVGQGAAVQSIVAEGCSISGRVEQSVLSPNCRVAAGSVIESTVLLPNVEIGRRCRIANAIIDESCRIPDDTVIGQVSPTSAGWHGVIRSEIALVTAADVPHLTRRPISTAYIPPVRVSTDLIGNVPAWRRSEKVAPMAQTGTGPSSHSGSDPSIFLI